MAWHGMAWHGGDITTEHAMSMAQIEPEPDLKKAAMNSGVLPTQPLSSEELARLELVDRILALVENGSTCQRV